VRSLYEDFGVSTILVIGGSGDYFQVCKPAVYGTDISYSACVRSGVHMKVAVGVRNSLGHPQNYSRDCLDSFFEILAHFQIKMCNQFR